MKRTRERTRLYLDIVTTGIEQGYNWFTYREIKRDGDLNVLRAKVFEVEETGDWETETTDHGEVSIATIAKAFGILNKGPVKYLSENERRRFLGIYAVPADADYDANDADTLLQLGILGEIRYA